MTDPRDYDPRKRDAALPEDSRHRYERHPNHRERKLARGMCSEPRCSTCDNTGMPLDGVNGSQAAHLRGCPDCGRPAITVPRRRKR